MSRTPLPRGSVIGIVGNGHLGRMLAEAARTANYRAWVFGPGLNSPAGQVADREFAADFADTAALEEFAAGADVITHATEHAPHAAIAFLSERKPVHPDPELLSRIDNRLQQLVWLTERGFPVPDFVLVRSHAELNDALDLIGTPSLLRPAANTTAAIAPIPLASDTDPDTAWAALGADEAVLEAAPEPQARLCVVCARSRYGDTRCFPVCQSVHYDGHLAITRAPADLPPDLAQRAQALALQAAQSSRAVGIFASDLLLLPGGELILERLVPRPHNAAHFSIDACSSSQFGHHILAITNRPLPRVEQPEPATTVSLMGAFWRQGSPPLDALRQIPRATLHLYGRAEPTPGARMGHLTVLGKLPPPLDAALTRLAQLQTFEPPPPPSPADRLPECLTRSPFLPFSILLADGRSLAVDDPSAIAPLRAAFVYQSPAGDVITFTRDDIRAVS